MRTMILAIPVFAAAAAFAASHAETTTYVDGNLNGVSPNSGATLTVSDEKQMTLRTGLANVTVPYEKISHVELGAVKENSHDVPFYKIWARHKSKTGTQLLIVNFKNDEGEDKTMTLELAQPAAASVFETIQTHSARNVVAASSAPAPAPAPAAAPAAQAETKADANSKSKTQAKADKPDIMRTGKESTEWWGDDWWKTKRNADKWNKTTGTNAPDQQ